MRAAFCPAPGTIELRDVSRARAGAGRGRGPRCAPAASAAAICTGFSGGSPPPHGLSRPRDRRRGGGARRRRARRCATAIASRSSRWSSAATATTAAPADRSSARGCASSACRRPGGFAESVAVPAVCAVPAARGLDWRARRADRADRGRASMRCVSPAVGLGHRVLVLGAGTVGLLCGRWRRAPPAPPRCWSRRAIRTRPAMARRLGAARVVRGDRRRRRASAPRMPPITRSTRSSRRSAATADTLAEAVRCVRPGGTVVVLGVFSALARAAGDCRC